MRTLNLKMPFLGLATILFFALFISSCQESVIKNQSLEQQRVDKSFEEFKNESEIVSGLKSVVIDFSETRLSTGSENMKTASAGLTTLNSLAPAIFNSESISVDNDKKAPFIATALSWAKEEDGPFEFEIRTSTDEKTWSDWSAIPRDEHGEEEASKVVSQLIFLDKNTHFIQYRIKVKPSASFNLKKLKIDFINPGITPQSVKDQIQQLEGKSAAAPCKRPSMITRSTWGSICGASTMCSGTPAIQNTTHIIIHHSAGGNSSSDWAAVVRSYQQYHVNTKGWSDIGYNYLVAPSGALYEGRAGGDKARGAHFCGKNNNTMGVCVMGNYEDYNITFFARITLEGLLAWKCEKDGLNATGTAYHSSSNKTLNRISGHRNGCSTACPGKKLYNILGSIRSNVKSKTNACDGADPCLVSNQDPVTMRTLQSMSEFIDKELKGNGKSLLVAYVKYEKEIQAILNSNNPKINAAFEHLKMVNQETLQEAFLYDIEKTVDEKLLANVNGFLIELQNAGSQELQKEIIEIRKGLNTMKGLEIKTALKAYDMSDLDQFAPYYK